MIGQYILFRKKIGHDNTGNYYIIKPFSGAEFATTKII